MKWTKEQEQAIYSDGQDTLVAAAAGSGKTAVLVERIIQKVLSKESPADIDSLLVVTFTNAAAEEMRNRVSEALEEALANNPTSLHLKKQLSFVQQASISTLHSFCMETIRQYAYLLDIDPAFRIANEMEADLMQQEVLDDLFEKWYGEENDEQALFFDVVDMFSSDRSDVDVEELILKLYTFSIQNPWPNEWLDELSTVYDVEHDNEDEIKWLSIVREQVETAMDAMGQEIALAESICESAEGPVHYLETIAKDKLMMETVSQLINDWDELQSFVDTSTFARLSSKRVECDETKRDEVKSLRDDYRKRWNDMKTTLFTRSLSSHLADMKKLAPVIRKLAQLVKEFSEEFTRRKTEQAIVDFADLEHYCLRLLVDESSTSKQIVPSFVAKQFQEKFSEVLVDEYQDTNLVQETILQLVSQSAGRGNLFMVGDVKQSIYGFRHAEPALFIKKYHEFQKDASNGLRIDLAKNFRSRQNVLTGTNFIFRQILDEDVGEIAYDADAELIYGNKTYDDFVSQDSEPELLIINRDSDEALDEDESYQALQKAQLEARAYAKKIKEWLGDGENEPLKIFDKTLNTTRYVTFKDMVILLRSIKTAPVIMEELKKQGIPTYAELPSGYFDAIEVKVMISLLKVIDNPRQDIPLASVLRSPIVRLNEEELTQIRLANRTDTYYEALLNYVGENDTETARKLEAFLKLLRHFRQSTRDGALSDLIWDIYRQTGYYDFVGGIPGGKQRQANLRALYDRARTYEETSYRGLFRFLRFIERMEERGDDLGAARGLSEQEDVIRITTIHKSKGLEYPIVIVGNLEKQFNLQDLNKKYLLDKDYGFATKFIDPVKRITFPTLYYHALRYEMKRKQLAEEMRVLYVALTRAREKLLMVASPTSLAKLSHKWTSHVKHPSWILPKSSRLDAKSYLDWIGPALIRHKDSEALLADEDISFYPTEEINEDESRWKITLMHAEELTEVTATEALVPDESLEESILQWKRVPIENKDIEQKVKSRLSYKYPYKQSTNIRAKQSVTEIKRMQEEMDAYSSNQIVDLQQHAIDRQPNFMQTEKVISAAERGTAMHTVMQHIPFSQALNKDELNTFIKQLVERELLTEALAQTINRYSIVQFYKTPIANMLKEAQHVYREVPFSLSLRASDIYQEEQLSDEKVLIQGIIDCIIPYEDGWLILDYKTDYIEGPVTDVIKRELKERYKIQMQLYKRAVEDILGKEVKQISLYFFSKNLLLDFDLFDM